MLIVIHINGGIMMKVSFLIRTLPVFLFGCGVGHLNDCFRIAAFCAKAEKAKGGPPLLQLP